MRIKLDERAVAIAVATVGPELVLDGIFRASPQGARADGIVIAAPHPLYGGSMESPVVAEMAWSAHKAGLASLRFNWRGVGASSGTPSGTSAHADEDFAAALEHLGETVTGRLVAAGYSFGAVAAVRVARREPRVTRLVLVAPPPALLQEEGVAGLERPVLLLGGSEDGLAPAETLAGWAEHHASVRFVGIPGADHFFTAGLAPLGAEIASWLGASPP